MATTAEGASSFYANSNWPEMVSVEKQKNNHKIIKPDFAFKFDTLYQKMTFS